jgi:hypothetical protein
MDLLRAAIVGPAGTPYHDGLFFFDVHFPHEETREKRSLGYNQTAFVLSCKTMVYSLQKPPKVTTEPSFLAKVLPY